jgi:DNA repair protein RecO (recombination protein O)
MSSLVKTEAIILKKKELLQKDILITLLTLEMGKVSVIAKGIKLITSRRAPHLQTGNLVNVILSHKTTTYYLQQTTLISGFQDIKNDPHKMSYLYTFFFIIDKILPEEHKEEEVYAIVKLFLIDLARSSTLTLDFLRPHLQKLLVSLGYVEGAKSLSELIQTTEEILNEKVPLHVIM